MNKEPKTDSLKNQSENFNENFTQEKEPIMIDNVSNFCLVCYYDNKNKELVRIEQYKDGSGDIQTDIESHKYGYNAKIIKPEELIKQLARKTAECELLETQLESYYIGEAKLVQRNQELEQECEQIKEKYEALKLENEEGYEIADELKQECEELKKQLETSEKWRIKAESLNENFELKNTCYRKALEEIETATKINCEEICGRKFTDCKDTSCFSVNILDIISRAKGEE